MAGDEEVEAVARAIAAHSGPVNNIDVARSAIATLDRVRSRPVGDEEVEAVARAISYALRPRAADVPVFDPVRSHAAAEVAIAALDRVRSRPAGGTEGEDHEAGIEAVMRKLAPSFRQHDHVHREFAESVIAAYKRASGLTPVGGTEPDTAKLVEAAQAALTAFEEWSQPGGVAPLWPRMRDLREALAGFSVDAGNPRPEQPAPDRLGGQPPSEPEEGR